MELPIRGARPQAQPTAPAPAGQAVHHPAGGGNKRDIPKPFRIAFVALLFAGAALIIALTLSFNSSGKSTSAENKIIKRDQYQAIFLNGGQVYFGKISDFNARFIKIEDIYYLRVQQQVQPGSEQPVQDISLAKLGNELHGPEDVMVINRDMVIFWENLKDDGQVVKAIVEYKKNPAAAQQQTQQNNNNSSNNGTNNSTNNTNSQGSNNNSTNNNNTTR